MPSYRGRFAPSPTGAAHLGTARTALVAWLRARQAGGSFVMRVEDLDGPRVVPGSAEGILADLRWLGLSWDEGPDVGGPLGPYLQSQCFDRYAAALERLRIAGHVYPCTCSRKEIAAIASAPDGEELVYPGTCRAGATHPERVPSFRFRFDAQPSFVDGVFGQRSFPSCGDFILMRADGVFAYQLAVVLDDIAMGITEVVRGEDLLSSTPRQLALIAALGAEPPSYFHVPLVLDESGERLGKRHGSLALSALRESGWTPERVVGLLGKSLGLDCPEEISAVDLVARFDPGRLRTEPTVLPSALLPPSPES